MQLKQQQQVVDQFKIPKTNTNNNHNNNNLFSISLSNNNNNNSIAQEDSFFHKDSSISLNFSHHSLDSQGLLKNIPIKSQFFQERNTNSFGFKDTSMSQNLNLHNFLIKDQNNKISFSLESIPCLKRAPKNIQMDPKKKSKKVYVKKDEQIDKEEDFEPDHEYERYVHQMIDINNEKPVEEQHLQKKEEHQTDQYIDLEQPLLQKGASQLIQNNNINNNTFQNNSNMVFNIKDSSTQYFPSNVQGQGQGSVYQQGNNDSYMKLQDFLQNQSYNFPNNMSNNNSFHNNLNNNNMLLNINNLSMQQQQQQQQQQEENQLNLMNFNKGPSALQNFLQTNMNSSSMMNLPSLNSFNMKDSLQLKMPNLGNINNNNTINNNINNNNDSIINNNNNDSIQSHQGLIIQLDHNIEAEQQAQPKNDSISLNFPKLNFTNTNNNMNQLQNFTTESNDNINENENEISSQFQSSLQQQSQMSQNNSKKRSRRRRFTKEEKEEMMRQKELQKQQKLEKSKNKVNTSHVPINMLNNLNKYLIKFYEKNIPCTCINSSQITNNKKSKKAKKNLLLNSENCCQTCKEKQILEKTKKQQFKNLACFRELWAQKRIRIISEQFFLYKGCNHILNKNYRNEDNRTALFLSLPSFFNGVRNHHKFWKISE